MFKNYIILLLFFYNLICGNGTEQNKKTIELQEHNYFGNVKNKDSHVELINNTNDRKSTMRNILKNNLNENTLTKSRGKLLRARTTIKDTGSKIISGLGEQNVDNQSIEKIELESNMNMDFDFQSFSSYSPKKINTIKN